MIWNVELPDFLVLPLGGPVPDGVVDAGLAPSVSRVSDLLVDGDPVLVSLDDEETELTAIVSVYAWLGVAVFRVPAEHLAAVRQALDMVASIKGVREPTLSRRGLA
jgi:hypothetical protein